MGPRFPILAALILFAPARAPGGEAPLPPSPARAPGARIGDAWSDPSNPIVRIFEGKRLDLWSFRKPVAPELPAVEDAAFRLALQREPTPAEKEVALRLISEAGDGGAAPPGGLLELSRALLNVNEFVYVD